MLIADILLTIWLYYLELNIVFFKFKQVMFNLMNINLLNNYTILSKEGVKVIDILKINESKIKIK